MADALADEDEVAVVGVVEPLELVAIVLAVGATVGAAAVLVSRDRLVGAGDAEGAMIAKSGLSTRTFRKMMSTIASRISKMMIKYQHMRLRLRRGSVCLHEHLWTPASLSARTLKLTVCSL